MRKPKVNIFVGPGTNCHHEKAYMYKCAGASPDFLLRNQWLSGKKKLHECDILSFAGGFLDGDRIRSAVVAADDFVFRFRDQMEIVLERGIPIEGNCNGFQLMVVMGILNGCLGKPNIMLDHNQSGTFEHWNNCRMVLHHNPGCIWTEGLDGVELVIPVGHGEGYFRKLTDEEPVWKVSATYGTYEGVSTYPTSPNGQPIAGISYKNMLGYMPHTERDKEGKDGSPPLSLKLYQNGVNAVR